MLDYETLYIFSLPAYLVFVIILAVKKVGWKHILIHSLLFYYIVAVISITLFPVPIQRELIEDSRELSLLQNNVVPFRSIADIIVHTPLSIAIRQIAGNIILFIPLGFLIPLQWVAAMNIRRVLLIGLLSTLGIEFAQLAISAILGFTYKVADIDDVLLNTLGCAIGYLLFKLFHAGTTDDG